MKHLNGWERLWLVATALASFAAFILFLGDPAIYDSVDYGGPAADQWLSLQRAEWGSRCIPGTWDSVNMVISARFSCYSIFVDGVPAFFGAVGVAFASFVVLLISRWVVRGFRPEKQF